MRCHEFRKVVSDYLDEVSDIRTDAEIKAHLSECDKCSALWASYQQQSQKLHALKTVPAPHEFVGMIHERLEGRQQTESLMHRFFYPLQIKIPLQVAVVFATVFLVIMLQRQSAPPTVNTLFESQSQPAKPETVAVDAFETVEKAALQTEFAEADYEKEKSIAAIPYETLKEESSVADRAEAPELTAQQAPVEETLEKPQGTSAPAAGALAEEKKGTPQAAPVVPPGTKDLQINLLAPPTPENMTKLQKIIATANGKVLQIYNENKVQHLIAEIPAAQHEAFIQSLKGFSSFNSSESLMEVANLQTYKVHFAFMPTEAASNTPSNS